MDKPDKIWVESCDDEWDSGVWGQSQEYDTDGKYLLATPERELASELVEALWQWLELAERTVEDHVLRLDANRAADFCQGIRETKTVLAKLDKGE